MRMRVLLAAGALAAVVPALAAAQQRPPTPAARPQTSAARPAATGAAHREGSFELSAGLGGVFADRRMMQFLDDRNVADDGAGRAMMGGVLRLGYNLNERMGVSVGTGYFTGQGATALTPFAAFTYTMDLNRKMAPFISAGIGLPAYGGSDGLSGFGAQVGVGVRSMVGEKLALRAEARMHADNLSDLGSDAAWTSANGTGSMAYNSLVTIGASYFMGGGPPRDTDADGVPDKRDRCASTPAGATVDLRGCPSDTDRDGVLNGLDRCANTPANTPVDRGGCTLDTDNDGIADNLDRCASTPANARPIDAAGCPVDTDGDSVFDYLDRCASTPAGTRVDANGCPVDSDNDGVLEASDRCPNTAANARPVDATGCPVDTDRDGVFDYLDTCPNTAAGTQVTEAGCPVQRDADRDGVIDANDRCPNTPSTARVDANGCPLAELPAVNAALIIRNITFRAGTSRLLPTSFAELDRIAASINATPNSRWEIGGHTDATGVAATNQRLSQQRAQAVMTYLASKGVSASAMTAVGFGRTRPVAPNTSAAGRAQNRRVEIKRIQ